MLILARLVLGISLSKSGNDWQTNSKLENVAIPLEYRSGILSL